MKESFICLAIVGFLPLTGSYQKHETGQPTSGLLKDILARTKNLQLKTYVKIFVKCSLNFIKSFNQGLGYV